MSTSLPMLFSAAINSTSKATRQAVRAIKQSYYLHVYALSANIGLDWKSLPGTDTPP